VVCNETVGGIEARSSREASKDMVHSLAMMLAPGLAANPIHYGYLAFFAYAKFLKSSIPSVTLAISLDSGPEPISIGKTINGGRILVRLQHLVCVGAKSIDGFVPSSEPWAYGHWGRPTARGPSPPAKLIPNCASALGI